MTTRRMPSSMTTRKPSETMPLVLPVSMSQTIRRVAAVRNVQGARVGRRGYLMSAAVQEALAEHLTMWQAEISKSSIGDPKE